MATSPQEHVSSGKFEGAPGAEGERVVISGMSGLYPQSKHVQDLENILYNKMNPVTSENCRWKYNHPEVPQYTGKAPTLDRFDAQFFKVHYRLAENMDSMGRKVLEQAFQAIYDAGLSPEHLYGRKVGVYIGSCFSETEKSCFYVASSRSGFGIAGCSKTMFANRISYWLNAKGPSMSIDEACCSSTAALEQAYLAITRGDCEAAIVGGSNLCLHPQSSVHYGRITTLCMDGKTKSFDQNADGLAKSEAINVLFLQKAKNAIRIYAEVVHVKSEFTAILEGDTGPKYGFYRDPATVAGFLKHFYEEARVPPQAVEYVEAFGSAVPEADKAELEAIDEVFCKDRTDPLLVGSVMSNIGYGEAASGISGITKVLLGYHKGELAANLHCTNPRTDVAGLRDGRMRIVTEHQSFGRSYTAVNGISVTGVNAHVLLHGHYKSKDLNRYKSSIPYLVNISARQDTAVRHILDDLKSRIIDPEELSLFHNIHGTRITGHMGRGYTILDTNETDNTVSLADKVSYFDDAKRPLWFVYSGMGSQWTGMGTQLMRIPIFAAAIERCQRVLESKGLDLISIITSTDKKTFDNILNSFVGIAAIQIGLTDILSAIGMMPDNIIGHSVGELGCAYADGCFSAEEMILAAYSRGLVSVETPFIRGSMAAVGIGYEKISKLVPPEIEIACHNSTESSTISGPADIMSEFVAKLTTDGIFAKEVPCSNIAYHSRYIAEAGPGLLKYLKEVIKSPKPRSKRWISTSVPQDKWDESAAKFSSAEYHTNNLLNPVLFEETSRLIPANAVVVEIAPHGLLQAILKRSLPESCRHIPLTRRGHADNAFLVLDAIGKLYMEGFNPKIQALYPKVEFPVSTGTPMLSHLVQWAHNEKWTLPLYVAAHRKTAASCIFGISVHDKEHSYLQGHVIRGKVLYAFSAALVAVWDTLAMSQQVAKKQLSVEFRDVHLNAQPVLHDQRNLRLSVTLHRGTGHFEIMDDNRQVMTGYIKGELQNTSKEISKENKSKENMNLTSDDVYQLMYMRDYFYGREFRSIYKANQSLTEAQIGWNNNWVTFIDGILQLNALRDNHDTVSQPRLIRRMCIDIEKHHNEKVIDVDGKTVMTAVVNEIHDFTRCGGVLVENIKFRKLPILNEDEVVLNTLTFVPRFQSNTDEISALQVYMQIVSENIDKKIINVVEIINNKKDDSAVNEIRNIFKNIIGITVNYVQMQREKISDQTDKLLTKVDVVIIQSLSTDDSLCQILYRVLPRETFLINREDTDLYRSRPSTLYRVVSAINDKHTKLALLKWRPAQTTPVSAVVSVRTRSDLDLLTATRSDLPQRHKLIVLSSYPPVSELKDLIRKWRKESNRNKIYLVMISDRDNLDQLPELDLVYNVLNNGVWGSEYYTSCQDIRTNGNRATLRNAKIGDVNHLHWVEAVEPLGLDIPVTVHYTAINDSDVQKATGVIQFKNKASDCSYGMDFSGIADSGERVMGLLSHGAASTRVMAYPELLWPVPIHWSLEDAATVPSAYSHAFYCLDVKVQLGRGMKILVHGGAGALGQAAISIALEKKCEVFATVSDIHKKRFLIRLFPELKEDHIGNSRDTSFGDMIKIATKGKGCDIIICCVKGEFKNISLGNCAHNGITLDATQIQSKEKFAFGMHYLTKERTYMSIDFTSIFENQHIEEMKQIQILVSEGIARGYVRPLSRVTYAAHEATRAFRLLASSAHRGRVLLRLHGSTLIAQPRLLCSTDHCHLLLCENNSFATHWAQRLINRGANTLRLHWSNPPAYLHHKLRSWEKLGVKVVVSSEDLNSNKRIITLINESNRLGPIEGIYVIAGSISDRTIDKLTTVVNNFDSASRKLCTAIKYFAVISAGSCIGQQICVSRGRDGLPATMVNLPAPDKVTEGANKEALSWRTALDGIERALRSDQHVVFMHPQQKPPASLLDQIATIADIAITEETVDSVTLKDLGIELAKVPAICSFLLDTYNASLAEDIIPNLTVQKIRQMEETINGYVYKEVRGLGTFFSYVDPDELLATTEMVFLPTLINNTTMRDDEFDVTQTYVCIVPGMEGHYERFSVLCERLKLPALVLQPGLDKLQETLRDTAERYAKILLKKTDLKNHFYLLGYESGVMVALEMANIIEEYGLKGTVFCIGGPPEEFQATLDEQLNDLNTEHALQDAVARHMFALMTGSTEGLDKALQSASTWHEKIEACVRTLLGRVAHSAQYARALIEAAYTQIKKARLYEPNLRPLKSRLVLLHAASMSRSSSRSPASLLQRYSQQPVVLEELRLPLAHATQDLRCAAIINKYLDEEILQAFEVKNLCETYLLNANTFMTTQEDFY